MRGQIVEVQGGHIVRPTGRKDRHSKVCTAKGPRDRRVRLSAHTAIQFYDVQDRLGYDRPSKAVDWLIKKAKPAIDELAKLPPWNFIATSTAASNATNPNSHEEKSPAPTASPISLGNISGINENHGGGGSGFFPVALEGDVTDTIGSLFPAKTSEPIRFQSYNDSNNNSNQDLRLSLQSLQEPILLHQHQAQNQNQSENEHVFFSGTTQFDGMVAWNAGADTGNSGHGGGGGGGGVIFSTPLPSPAPVISPALFFGQSQYLSQRGPLQSSNTPSVHAWTDAPSMATAAAATVAGDHYHHHIYNHNQYFLPAMMYQSTVPGTGFGSGGFSGFRVPARIQGVEEEHDGISDKPSSASSDSRH